MPKTTSAWFALSCMLLGCASHPVGQVDAAPSGAGQSGTGGNSSGIDAGPSLLGRCGAAKGQLFDGSYPWNQTVDAAPVDAESTTIINYLQTKHTGSQRFRIDGPSETANAIFGLTLLVANASTPREAFTPTDDFFTPDCDTAPVPLPEGGSIEGETGYGCAGDGDCHLIVLDPVSCRLHEMWRTNRTASGFSGGCQAVWELQQPYKTTLRGECCTSADAAGLPIAAHTFTADEIADGEIRHAIRFILPNEHMRALLYVHPATHSTGRTSGPAEAPPYGARLRLKASADLSRLKPAAKIVAKALQAYGMFLSDGGKVTFTAANDRFTQHKWPEVGLLPSDLTSLNWSDFEVIEDGPLHTFDNQCDCNHIPVAH